MSTCKRVSKLRLCHAVFLLLSCLIGPGVFFALPAGADNRDIPPSLLDFRERLLRNRDDLLRRRDDCRRNLSYCELALNRMRYDTNACDPTMRRAAQDANFLMLRNYDLWMRSRDNLDRSLRYNDLDLRDVEDQIRRYATSRS